MITSILQMIFDQYSSPVLYATALWFGVVGYLATACVVMLLTRLSFRQIMQPLLVIFVRCLAISFLLTPILAAFFFVIMNKIFMFSNQPLAGGRLYVIFVITMLSRVSAEVASFFVQAPYSKWRRAFFITYILLSLLGEVVLMNLHVW